MLFQVITVKLKLEFATYAFEFEQKGMLLIGERKEHVIRSLNTFKLKHYNIERTSTQAFLLKPCQMNMMFCSIECKKFIRASYLLTSFSPHTRKNSIPYL